MAALAARRSSGPVIRSISPSSTFNRHYSATHHSTPSHSSSAAGSLHRPAASPALYNYSSPSLRFSMDRPGSPSRSISFTARSDKPAAAAPQKKQTCMCSPTNHPGSFRCSLHKANKPTVSRTASCGSSSRLNMRRSAMKNSLVRIGTVEGDLVTRALAALIRPSSHNQRRRGEFRPRPSRLSAMAKS